MQGKGDGTGILRFAVNSKASDGFFCFSFVKEETPTQVTYKA